MEYTNDLWMMVLIPAVLIGGGEWFFHKWLLKNDVVPDERKMK
ncbi:MAG: hypothetical protein ABS896_05705 [Carnobacterium inhibens]